MSEMSKENEVRNAISDIYTQLSILEGSLEVLYDRVIKLDARQSWIKPKEPEWYENIPEHGVLAKIRINGETQIHIIRPGKLDEFLAEKWTPLTNEEIERFKR